MATEAKTAQVKAISGDTSSNAPAKAPLQLLKRGDAALFEFTSNIWRVAIPAGVSAKELEMHPTFWNALADEIRAGDEIKAMAIDRSWLARFEVVDSVPGRLLVRLAYVVDGAPALVFAAGPKPMPEGYRIERTKPGERDGYLVIRERDGHTILDSGMPWRSHQDCYEGFLKNAIFRTDSPTKYIP